ncbi:MAG: immunoglobulin domain-containing protein, partial [Opitutales bacterium]|nr:immunoglobulin domain-containing protein [Opitutales bacterium]
TFTVEAEGEGTLLYQWRKDGEAIDEATSSTLTLDPVVLDDAGIYTVVVSNDGGNTTSDEAVLTVEEVLSPYEQWLLDNDLDGEDEGTYTLTKGGREVTLREAYLLGSDPHDPSDVLRVTVAESTEPDSMELHFRALSDRVYRVEYSNDLVTWEPYGETEIHGNEEDHVATVGRDSAQNPRRFYRIRVSFP